MTPEPRHTKQDYVTARVQRYLNAFFRLIGPRPQFRVPGPNARTAAMEITPMVSMAAESTDTERAQTSASHRHHHTHRATPIVTSCAARRDSTRAKRSSMAKSHAAARKQSTLHPDRHSSFNHSPAQALARAITSATWVRTSFQLDACFLGTQLVGSESCQAVLRKRLEERQRAQRGDARRCRSFRAASRPNGLAASALRHAASATATSELSSACMHAAMAHAHEIYPDWPIRKGGWNMVFDLFHRTTVPPIPGCPPHQGWSRGVQG